jgi:hypothetical protein
MVLFIKFTNNYRDYANFYTAKMGEIIRNQKNEDIIKVKHTDYQPPHRLLSKMFFVGSDYQSLTVFYSLIESKTY